MIKMFGYPTYSFIDKDPILDLVRTVIQESGKNYLTLSALSGVSARTIYNWLHGKTKKPQAAPINAVLRACGYKLDVNRIESISLVEPTLFQPKVHVPLQFKYGKLSKHK